MALIIGMATIYKNRIQLIIYNLLLIRTSLQVQMSQPTSQDISPFQYKFSEDTLKREQELFPNKPYPYKINRDKDPPAAKQQERTEQIQSRQKPKHDNTYLRMIYTDKQKLSSDFKNLLLNLSKTQAHQVSQARKDYAMGERTRQCLSIRQPEEKEVEIWAKKKSFREKKCYMPTVVSNPFDKQDIISYDDSQANRWDLPKKGRSKQKYQSQEASETQNPFYLDCLKQLRQRREIPESKKERKRKKIQQKCEQLLFGEQHQVQESQNTKQLNQAKPSQINNQLPSKKNQDKAGNQQFEEIQGYSTSKKVKLEKCDSIYESQPRVKVQQDEYTQALQPIINELKSAQAKDFKANQNIVMKCEKQDLSGQSRQKSVKSKPIKEQIRQEKKQSMRVQQRPKPVPQFQPSCSQYNEKGCDEGKGDISSQLLRISKAKQKIMKKLQDLEVRSRSKSISQNEFLRLQSKKKKNTRIFQELIQREEKQLSNEKKFPSFERSKGHQQEHTPRRKRETEWEKYYREKKEKKQAEEKLWKDYQNAIERSQPQAQAPLKTSTKHFESFLSIKEEIRSKAKNSIKNLIYKKPETAQPIDQSEAEHSKKFYPQKGKDESKLFKHPAAEKESDLSKYKAYPFSKHQKVNTNKKVRFIEQQNPSREDDWRNQLKKITHYDPRSLKYRQRDQGNIKQSNFERIQIEEHISRKMGRKEEEYARAFERSSSNSSRSSDHY